MAESFESSHIWNFVVDVDVGTTDNMHIISRKRLVEFWMREPESRVQLEAWFAEARHANWASPVDIKAMYGSASILKSCRVVFNICGNNYRLVVQIRYCKGESNGTVFIRFAGTHAEYDAIDAQTI